jgi:site-specific DNA-cytosine methylase
MLTVGSLFSGCLGLDLGLEATGLYRIAWACESDDACRRVIGRRRPHLTVYPDVREVAQTGAVGVDVIVGGFPDPARTSPTPAKGWG